MRLTRQEMKHFLEKGSMHTNKTWTRRIRKQWPWIRAIVPINKVILEVRMKGCYMRRRLFRDDGLGNTDWKNDENH
ncbi:unnamed protein product [Prunus armeniaca]